MIETLCLNLVTNITLTDDWARGILQSMDWQTQRDYWKDWTFPPTPSWRKIHLSRVIRNCYLWLWHIKLCAKNEIVIIPHNLTNKFRLLDVSASKAENAYVSQKYNTWMGNETSKQLKKNIPPPNVKVSLLFIVDLYHHLKADREMIVTGLIRISDAIKNA